MTNIRSLHPTQKGSLANQAEQRSQSVAIASEVTPAASFNPNADGLNLPKLISILSRRRRLALFVGIVITTLVWGNAFLSKESPLYEGSFEVLVEGLSQEPNPQIPADTQNQTVLLDEADFETIIRLMQSDAFIHSALKGKYPNFSQQFLTIARVPDTKLISVSYQGSDSLQVRAIIDALSTGFLNYARQRELVKLNQGLSFLEQQFPGLESKVNLLESELEKFRQQYNFIDPTSQANELVTQLNSNNQSLRETQTELAKQQARYQVLQKQVKLTPETAFSAVGLGESSRYQQLLNDLLDLDKRIALESARVQPGNPTLQALQEKKAKLKPLLDQQAKQLQNQRVSAQLTPIALDLAKQLITSANEINVLRRQQSILTTQREVLQRQFENYPSLARQYQTLQRNLDIAERNLRNFLEARERIRLEASQKSVPWELVSAPSVNLLPPSGSLAKSLLLGLFLGSLAGIGAAILRDRCDHVYHSSQEVKDDLKLPLLASLPYSPLQPADSNWSMADNLASAPVNIIDFLHLEAFRSLYTNLRLLGADTPIRTIAVASTIAGEGKSTVACQLAKTALSMDQRVLLIDADLRRPTIHQQFKLNNEFGLSSVLTGLRALEQSIQQTDAGLAVLTSGQCPPDPIRLLTSERMTKLIEKLQSSTEYDLVIFDTPQVIGLADTSSFAQSLDGLLFVVSLDKVDRDLANEAIEYLQFSNITLLGSVTNAISQRSNIEQKIINRTHYSYYYSASSQTSKDNTSTSSSLCQTPFARLQNATKSAWNWLESR